LINAFSNYFQEVIHSEGRLKKHDDAFPYKVKQNNLHATYSCCTFIMFIESMNLSIWFSGKLSSLGSNLGKSFSGCLGRGFRGPRMERTVIVSHRGLASMLPPKVKFNRGDRIESKGGLISRGSRGPEPPT
jgi:hypothetical protein